MTDNEIIKALGSCLIKEYIVAYYDDEEIIVSDILNLINRQKAEISELQHRNSELEIELQAMREAANSYKAEIEMLNEYISRCKSGEEYWVKCLLERPNEAIKKFARKFKAKSVVWRIDNFDMGYQITDDEFDNLVKEMVGDDNG